MTTVLHIDSTATTGGSVTRSATSEIVRDLNPDRIIVRDLAATPLPQITDAWVRARLVDDAGRTDEEHAALALSEELIAEIEAADVIVIGAPIYNFGMPAALKAWIDLVARPRRTFAYTADGPKGLITGKRAIIAAASGGVSIGSGADFATPHLHFVLKFLGITDVTLVNAADIAPKQAA